MTRLNEEGRSPRGNFLQAACVALLLAACAHGPHQTASPTEADQVARAFSQATVTILDTDWVEYDRPAPELFSEAELRILGEYPTELERVLERVLGSQESVNGAKLAAQLRMTSLVPVLRSRFYTPHRCYGWEGPDYTKLESYLADDQYQYNVAYLAAIEQIAGQPVAKAVPPTPDDIRLIDRCAGNPESEYYHWALWMRRKLALSDGVQ